MTGPDRRLENITETTVTLVKHGSSSQIAVFTVGALLIFGNISSVCAQQATGVPFSRVPAKTGLAAEAPTDKGYHGSVGAYTPLSVLWRIRTGGGDRTITVDSNERDLYPLDGAIFYVPMKTHPALGTVPLYRLYNGGDHMVSLNPHDGAAQGYHVEGILGYPFVSQQPGTSELIRTYNPATGHHSLRNSTGLESEEGYVDQPMGVFGYPRYYNQSEKLLTLSGGGITVDSNEVAGGSLWQWTWNGVQVINNWDYGRQIQTDIFPLDFANPTEAGDTWSNYPRPAVNHGSPVALAENVGLTQRTRAIPLEYDPDGTQQCVFQQPPGPCPGFGGGQDNPVAWQDVVLGKDLTLDFKGLGPVALYSTFMQVPKVLALGTAREIPVIYARANFYRMFSYDAGAGQLQEHACSDGAVSIAPSYGGVIATTGNADAAIGIYAVNTTQGGSVDFLVLNFTWSCPGPPTDTGEFGSDTMIGDAVRYTGYRVGTTVTNVYLISGTLQTVAEKMAALYQMRDSIPR